MISVGEQPRETPAADHGDAEPGHLVDAHPLLEGPSGRRVAFDDHGRAEPVLERLPLWSGAGRLGAGEVQAGQRQNESDASA